MGSTRLLAKLADEEFVGSIFALGESDPPHENHEQYEAAAAIVRQYKELATIKFGSLRYIRAFSRLDRQLKAYVTAYGDTP